MATTKHTPYGGPNRGKTFIHVNQHVIRSNNKTGERKPVITAKTSKDNRYGHEVAILDEKGAIVATIIYRPDQPLACGARVWIETRNPVKVIK